MRVSGVDALTLRTSSGGGFAVALEWTDQADPSPLTAPTILEVEHLLDLAALLESLTHEVEEGLDK